MLIDLLRGECLHRSMAVCGLIHIWPLCDISVASLKVKLVPNDLQLWLPFREVKTARLIVSDSILEQYRICVYLITIYTAWWPWLGRDALGLRVEARQ